jgi:hypothetical protein
MSVFSLRLPLSASCEIPFFSLAAAAATTWRQPVYTVLPGAQDGSLVRNGTASGHFDHKFR